jgi:hypothetical protein
LKVIPHDLVERLCELLACGAPTSDPGEEKCPPAAKPSWVEILMSNRVPPVVQVFEECSPGLITIIMVVHLRPEVDAKATEIGTDTAGLCVAPVEMPYPREFGL